MICFPFANSIAFNYLIGSASSSANLGRNDIWNKVFNSG
jgi:hypothetical protein